MSATRTERRRRLKSLFRYDSIAQIDIPAAAAADSRRIKPIDRRTEFACQCKVIREYRKYTRSVFAPYSARTTFKPVSPPRAASVRRQPVSR